MFGSNDFKGLGIMLFLLCVLAGIGLIVGIPSIYLWLTHVFGWQVTLTMLIVLVIGIFLGWKASNLN